MIVRLLHFAFVIAFAFGAISPAHASIKDDYAKYLRAPGKKAFAFSPLGNAAYAAGARTSLSAREMAARACAKVTYSNEAACMIGDVDGRIVHERFREVLAGVIRRPADIEITDKKTGKTERFTGAVVIGQYWSRNPTSISLVRDDGRRLCEDGKASIGFGLRFSITCDGKRYSGKAKRRGHQRTGFYKGAIHFQAQVSSGDKVMTVTTREK